METYELLKKLGTVKAPADFEQKLMAQLSLRKKARVRRKTLSFSLAGAFAGVLVLVLAVNFFILPGRNSVPYTAAGKNSLSVLEPGGSLQSGETIPIIEAVDFSSEIRTLAGEVPTVYILEQVSWATDAKIRY